ncbi:hybrid nucleoside-diphosphate sugar epimerase/sugar transferase [Psychrobacter aquaticus]|uniref:UDP-glucose 4-epimerase n=1 Tax=Psychrobacter aquaticus CMS 56 TaxID=1354303 RepID=U4T7U8_9GAMM|nr:hybrid nucleoside-diphosphate sugar epimerase/sugar transferase [Psychrobacter aquaticus]ERL56206.1 UDP-glucose 4-epimerase [Psychrobacter aquaticus CMS 56]
MSNVHKLLLTGATGFVGSALQQRIVADENYDLTIAVRKVKEQTPAVHTVKVNDLNADTDWSDALEGVDVIIHSAARVHVMDDKSADPLAEFRKVNVEGTLNLARQAVEARVKRFIFISSIKVNGEGTELGKSYTTDSKPNPIDPYGVSKYEAEQGLLKIAETTSLEVVIIRPTLVYGENVKGNFHSLMKWTYKGIPLPIGGIKQNLRSLVSVDNLVDFIITCIEHKDAKNEVFLISDDNDISTADLLEEISKGLGVKNKALNIPPKLINTAAGTLGKSSVAQRLSGSLQVDISKAKNLLGWKPKYSTSESIQKAAKSYKLNVMAPKSMTLQRPLDIMFSATGLIVASPLLIGATAIGYLDTGSPLFIQERVGKDQKPFKLIKFRTMKVTTESVASHLVDNTSITKLGKVLRKTKLDELPQLINVLKGEMSLVGPRPNLFNQKDLIEAREQMRVYDVLPGITGLAQLSGIDMSTPERLAKKDKEMIDSINLKNYFSYILNTALGKGSGDAIK